MHSPIILCDNVDVAKLTFSDFVNHGLFHYISYIEHNKKDFIFQTPKIQLTAYGISPSITQKNQPPFIKIPIDPTQHGCLKLKTMFDNIDQHIIENKDTLFNKIGTPVLYEHTIKNPNTINADFDGDENNKKNPTKMEYIKLSILRLRNIFVNMNGIKKIDINQTVSNGNISNLTNIIKTLQDHLTFGSTIRTIIGARLLVGKNKLDNNSLAKASLSLNLISLEITPRAKYQFDPLDAFSDLINETDNDIDDDIDDDIISICI